MERPREARSWYNDLKFWKAAEHRIFLIGIGLGCGIQEWSSDWLEAIPA